MDQSKTLRFSIVLGLPQDPKVKGDRGPPPPTHHYPRPPNNFQKKGPLILKIVKMTLSEGQILIPNFGFRGHTSTFRAKNKTKIGPLKAENNS